MKREIREVDPVRGILQWTGQDERFYARQVSKDGTEENKRWDFVPSVSWIVNFYPKGEEFVRWVAKHGWDEAEQIKNAGGRRGSKVHQAINYIVRGGTVTISMLFENPKTGAMEELDADEYFCVMTFIDWCEKEKPQWIDAEYTVWNEYYRYAGTVDLKCRLKSTKYRVVHIIDVKTSSSVWPSMELQVSAYKHADPDAPKSTQLGILQVGFKKNKKQKWRYTAVKDQFQLFLAVRKIWAKETEGQDMPLQREFPLSLEFVSPFANPLALTPAGGGK